MKTPPIRTPRSYFAFLPPDVRAEINRKLYDGCRFRTVRDWLFAQKADRDIPDLNLKAGDSYSTVWLRASKSEGSARENCLRLVAHWHRTYYLDWLKERAERDESLRLIERVEQLTSDASTKNRSATHTGGNLMIRSLLLEAIQNVRKGGHNPAELARLANAWARMSQVDEHTIDIGFEALLEQIKANPQALEAFNNLRAVVKGTEKQPKSTEPR